MSVLLIFFFGMFTIPNAVRAEVIVPPFVAESFGHSVRHLRLIEICVAVIDRDEMNIVAMFTGHFCFE
jgi:hypothetical protein